jgi:hypothetical protein
MNMRSTEPSYEQIRNLLGRYTDCIDLGDFDGVAAILADAALEDRHGNLICRGGAEISQYFASVLRLYEGVPSTKHVTANAQIAVDEAAGTATSTSSYVVFQSTPVLPLQPIITGRYLDQFVRGDDGCWRFGIRRYVVDGMGDVSQHTHRTPNWK